MVEIMIHEALGNPVVPTDDELRATLCIRNFAAHCMQVLLSTGNKQLLGRFESRKTAKDSARALLVLGAVSVQSHSAIGSVDARLPERVQRHVRTFYQTVKADAIDILEGVIGAEGSYYHAVGATYDKACGALVSKESMITLRRTMLAR
jgi:hypothetical protein